MKIVIPQTIIKLNRWWYYDSTNGKKIYFKKLEDYVNKKKEENLPNNQLKLI